MAFWGKDEKSETKKPRSSRVPSLLRHACDNGASASLALVELGRFVNARFVSVTETTVQMDILNELDVSLPRLTFVSVNFQDGGRGSVFLAQLSEFHKGVGGRLPRISLNLPPSVSVVEMRAIFRIPVAADCELKINLKWKKAKVELPAKAFDISRMGVGCEVAEDVETLPKGNPTVEITFAGKKALVKGSVRRFRNQRLGIFFTGSMKNGVLTATPELTQLVVDVEREWLRKRAETRK